MFSVFLTALLATPAYSNNSCKKWGKCIPNPDCLDSGKQLNCGTESEALAYCFSQYTTDGEISYNEADIDVCKYDTNNKCVWSGQEAVTTVSCAPTQAPVPTGAPTVDHSVAPETATRWVSLIVGFLGSLIL